MEDDPRRVLRAWLAGQGMPPPETPCQAEALLRSAEQQGLVGLLADDATPSATWPAQVHDRLRQAARGCLVRTTRQLALAARLHALLLDRGLRSLPLKGAAVAETLYDSPGHRPMGDVDLLAIDDPEACLAVLLDQGLALTSSAEHAWALVDPVTGYAVELHSAAASCPGLFSIDAEGLWLRRDARAGQVACVPSPADLLLLLSLHAVFQHGLVLRLSQWLDFRRLVERFPAAVCVPSSPYGVMSLRAVAAALLVAETVVGAPISRELRQWAETTLPRRARRAAGRSKPLSFVDPERPHLAAVRWHLAAGRRTQLLRATLFPRGNAGAPGLLARVARTMRRVCRLVSVGRQ